MDGVIELHEECSIQRIGRVAMHAQHGVPDVRHLKRVCVATREPPKRARAQKHA